MAGTEVEATEADFRLARGETVEPRTHGVRFDYSETEKVRITLCAQRDPDLGVLQTFAVAQPLECLLGKGLGSNFWGRAEADLSLTIIIIPHFWSLLEIYF